MTRKLEIESDKSVRLGRVDGDIRAGERVTIEAEDGKLVVVTGKVEFGGGAEVRCSLECESLKVGRHGSILVKGDLTASGSVRVDREIEVDGVLKADRVEVGGRISAGSIVSNDVDVGGRVEVRQGLDVVKITVGGQLDAPVKVNVRSLSAGGSAEIGNGKVEDVDVGGTFSSTGDLSFVSIDVGGWAELASSVGVNMDVGGRVTATGDLECEEIDVGGVVEVRGNMKGRRISVGGRLRVQHDLQLTGRLEVGGSAEIDGSAECQDMRVGGMFRANRAVLTGEASIGGHLETKEGFKAYRIELSNHARCDGPLVGERVILGNHSVAGDIYAKDLTAGKKSRMRKVFANRADFDWECEVEQVTYVESLNHDRLREMSPASKVDSLPPPPL